MKYKIYNYNLKKSRCYSYYYVKTTPTFYGEYNTYLEMPTRRQINCEPYRNNYKTLSTESPVDLLDVLFGIDRKEVDDNAKKLVCTWQRFQEVNFEF